MLRREFFSFAAAGVAAAPQNAETEAIDVAGLIEQIDKTIRREVPGVTRVEIIHDPANRKMPLMIAAFCD